MLPPLLLATAVASAPLRYRCHYDGIARLKCRCAETAELSHPAAVRARGEVGVVAVGPEALRRDHQPLRGERGDDPEVVARDAVVRRLGTVEVQRAGISGEQRFRKFADFLVAFLGSEGRLE